MNDNKQCICPECGAIAEVRRRKNGQRLRYMHCINGHGGLGNATQAAAIEAIEQDYIGELGDMPGLSEQLDIKQPVSKNIAVPESISIPADEVSQAIEPSQEAVDGSLSKQLESLQENTSKELEPGKDDESNLEINSAGGLKVAAFGLLGLIFGAGVYLRFKRSA